MQRMRSRPPWLRVHRVCHTQERIKDEVEDEGTHQCCQYRTCKVEGTTRHAIVRGNNREGLHNGRRHRITTG